MSRLLHLWLALSGAGRLFFTVLLSAGVHWVVLGWWGFGLGDNPMVRLTENSAGQASAKLRVEGRLASALSLASLGWSPSRLSFGSNTALVSEAPSVARPKSASVELTPAESVTPAAANFVAFGYTPPELLHETAVPVSSPDFSVIQSFAPSGQPMRLRLYIDARGWVQQVDALQLRVEDAGMLDVLREMFKRTRYIPAIQDGQVVASYQDVEISFVDPATETVPKYRDFIAN